MSRAKPDVRSATQDAVDELARLLVAAGLGFGEFADIARGAFVRAVAKELRASGERVTRSAIAAATGLTRQDVARHLDATVATVVPRKRLTRAQRFADVWRNHPELSGAALSVDRRGVAPATPSFNDLVRRAGVDVPPRAMQRELLRSGLARLTQDGRIVLRAQPKRESIAAIEALRSATPWLKAVTAPAARNARQPHASLRWSETRWASERELLVALQRVLRRRDALLKAPGPIVRRGRTSGRLAIGVAVIAQVDDTDEQSGA